MTINQTKNMLEDIAKQLGIHEVKYDLTSDILSCLIQLFINISIVLLIIIVVGLLTK